jgi:hypothetical protein
MTIMMITRVTSIITIDAFNKKMYNIIFTEVHQPGFTQA